MRETPMMIAHFCVKKTFLSHLYENVANHDFDRFRPRKLFVKISSICYQKRKWNIKHKRFIEQSISYHIGWSTLRSKVLKIAFFSYFTMYTLYIYLSKFLLDIFHHFDKDIKDHNFNTSLNNVEHVQTLQA